MRERQVRPYGSWASPITSDLIVAGTAGLTDPAIDGDDIYWVESRPSEGGRNVIVRRQAEGRPVDVTPAGFNARTTVHEYGGGSYVVDQGVVYFSNFADQQIYEQRPGSDPQAITRGEKMRYADYVIDRARARLIAVREDHGSGSRDTDNTIVSVRLDGTGSPGGDVLVSGGDFYSSPRLSPDGRRLAYLTWNHPNMPWDGTELWVAELNDDGSIASQACCLAGIVCL